jgi:hypothetical protein
MRLTLRTLLAYLDDTLEPAEIKAIGQKVAESDAAQELIARIKQVTRRRRLTTPPLTGPNARFDANAIAEYLDSELSGEMVAELEKLCLESDVHLAEIAACHQILTLVVGEPAMVPPTAKDRMYGLVHGREAIPKRRPAVTAQAPREDNGVDETLLPGLSLTGARAPWLVWALPVAGVVLILVAGAILAFAVYISSNRQPTPTNPVTVADNSKKDGDGNPSNQNDPKQGDHKGTEQSAEAKTSFALTSAAALGQLTQEIGKLLPDQDPRRQAKVDPPSTRRRIVGNYQSFERLPSIMLSREADKPDWHRLQMGESVFSSDALLALPGYAGEVRFANGGTLLLRGQILEYARHPLNQLLLESVVTLHDPPQGFDLDLTLHRGRIYLTNQKADAPLIVRLRMLDEVWDLTLLPRSENSEPTEIGVMLLRTYVAGQNWNTEEPRSEIYLMVLQGRTDLQIDYRKFPLAAPPGLAAFAWESIDGSYQGPDAVKDQAIAPTREAWNKTPPTTDLGPALKELSSLMVSGKNPAIVLTEEAGSDRQDHRLLAIYGLGALDQVPKLLDVLNDADPAHTVDRELAIFVLKRWRNRSLEQGKKLYDAKNPDRGILHDKKYTPREAELLFTLLHNFTEKDAQRTETFQLLVGNLNNDKQAIRELCYWHLRRLSQPPPQWKIMPPKIPPFNSAWTEDQRRTAIDAFRKLLDEGALPLKPPMQP